MADVPAGPEREPAKAPRGACIALLVLPGALALLVHVAAGMLSRAPSLGPSFQPRAAVFQAFLALGIVYAVVVTVLMNRVRLASPRPVGSRPGRDDVTVGTVLGAGLMAGGMVTLFGALFICGAINRIIGTVTTERGSISVKRLSQARGCHHAITVVSATVPDGQGLCLAQADWDRLEEGDSLPVVSIASALGRQAGLAPGALAQSTKREP